MLRTAYAVPDTCPLFCCPVPCAHLLRSRGVPRPPIPPGLSYRSRPGWADGLRVVRIAAPPQAPTPAASADVLNGVSRGSPSQQGSSGRINLRARGGPRSIISTPPERFHTAQQKLSRSSVRTGPRACRNRADHNEHKLAYHQPGLAWRGPRCMRNGAPATWTQPWISGT